MPEEKNQEAAETKEKGGKGVMLPALIGLVVIIGGAFLFTTFAVPKAAPGEEGVEGEDGIAEEELELAAYDVPELLVNLKDSRMKNVVKIHINLLYRFKDPDMTVTVFEEKDPEIRNALILLLSEKTVEDVEGSEPKELLREEIREALNRVVFPKARGEITKVHYVDFIVK